MRCHSCPRSLRDQTGARHQLKPPLHLASPLTASPTFPRVSPESVLSTDRLDKSPCLRLCCPKAQGSSIWVSVSLDRKWGSWIHCHWWVYFTSTDYNLWVFLHTLYQDIQVYPFSILSLSYIFHWRSVPSKSNSWTLKCFSAREHRSRSQEVRPGPEEMLVNKGFEFRYRILNIFSEIEFHCLHHRRHLSSSKRDLPGLARL